LPRSFTSTRHHATSSRASDWFPTACADKGGLPIRRFPFIGSLFVTG
jgi:hypothetical protein